MKRKDQDQPDIIVSTGTDSGEPNLKVQKMSEPDTASTKNEKYDRQLRLWGEDGQHDLETAHICLINVTAVGAEILKCLILPGIGKFTIIDNSNVTIADLGSNFFLNTDSIGKSKAQSTCELLQELNNDTMGNHYCQDPMELLANNPQFYEQFSLVICSRLSEQNNLKLGEVLWRSNIPMVLCDTFGFIGYARLVIKEHVIIKAQLDNVLEDFRLDCPPLEVQKYMEKMDLDSMENLEHSHTPFLVLLYKYLEKWRSENNLHWPQSYSEKRQIRDMIREGIRKNEHDVPMIEENYDEAIKNCNSAFSSTRVPNEINDILKKSLNYSRVVDHSESNSNFWILVNALREFVKLKGVLPVRGTLPDMFSDSKRYIELQNIYKNMANCDAQLVFELVAKYLKEHQLPPSLLTFEEVKVFCKNAYFLRVIPGLSLHDEMKQEKGSNKLKDTLESDSGFASQVYIVSRALNRFCDNGPYPFQNPADDTTDMQRLTTITEHLIQELGLKMNVPTNYFQELLRCKMSDVHVIASIFGGMVSHEVIKVLTRQFIPINNTVFYSGMTQETGSLKL